MSPARFTALAVALGSALAGCVDHSPDITGTQSLQIDLVTPSDPGSETARLPATQLGVSFDVTALGVDGEVDTTFNNDVQVYVQYLGTLTPYLGGTPLLTVHMSAGKSTSTSSMTLPPVFGPTTLWFDDYEDTNPTYATGTSPVLWYRDPFIQDIQTPVSETAPDALYDSPLENKNVQINGSRHTGSGGALVVTSVFSQGYTLADVQCGVDGSGKLAPPCTGSNYDFIEVFSYSAPQDQNGNIVSEGEVISGFAGGISEFDGLTEVGFPQTFVGNVGSGSNDILINTALEPPAAEFDSSWFVNTIMFERNEAAVIEVKNATVCPLTSDYTTYNQWTISPSGNCTVSDDLISLITTGVVQLDPSQCVGKVLPSVVGTLRPLELSSGFNVWLVYPRGSADMTLPPGDAQCRITGT